MHLFINSLAASAGGGLTYIRNVIPRLAVEPGVEVTVAVSGNLQQEFSSFPNVRFLNLQMSAPRRFLLEQSELPKLIRQHRCDVLLSAGNFAIRKSPVPQILLSRNSVYTSDDFYRDLLERREYRTWLDTRIRGVLAKKSIQWSDATVAPSEAFAEDLRRWTGKPICAIHHGFDRDAFTQDGSPLSPDVETKVRGGEVALTLLFVSHYNYYRNFETLLRALPILQKKLLKRPLRLLLTCRLVEGTNPGAYHPERAARLVETLGIRDVVIELGSVPYQSLHHLYRRADIYVTPAYTETFAHPLVEAMSSGLPVVASDIPVHREICGQAAKYFPRFSPDALAERVIEVANSTEISTTLAREGERRSQEFSWKKHVEAILRLANSLITSNSPRSKH